MDVAPREAAWLDQIEPPHSQKGCFVRHPGWSILAGGEVGRRGKLDDLVNCRFGVCDVPNVRGSVGDGKF